MSDKNGTRQQYKAIRKSIQNRIQKEAVITDRIMSEYGSYRSVFCYQSFGSEVSTAQIIRRFTELGAAVYAPLCIGEEMRHKSVIGDEVTDKPCELTIVPLLAFDGCCDRLGYGKGFYDRYLATHKTTAVGIAFDEQYCENLPKESTDRPLNAIVTPNGVIKQKV